MSSTVEANGDHVQDDIRSVQENHGLEISNGFPQSETDLEKQSIRPRTSSSVFGVRRRSITSSYLRGVSRIRRQGTMLPESEENLASLDEYWKLVLLICGREDIENYSNRQNYTNRRTSLAARTFALFLFDKFRELFEEGLTDSVISTVHQDVAANRLVLAAIEIAKLRRGEQNVSIDGKRGRGLVSQLVKKRVFNELCLTESNNDARQVVFAILGWMTMLYDPQVDLKSHNFQIAPDAPTCFTTTTQSCEKATRPFPEILYAFGKVMPEKVPNLTAHGDDDILSVASFNVNTLETISNTTIKWVYSLSAHLDFNTDTRQISLFCLPSFCEIHQGSNSCLEELFRTFHSPLNRPNDFSVQTVMREVLLSYHLLFRDNVNSRRQYRKTERLRIQRMNSNIGGRIDPILDIVCGAKDFSQSCESVPCKSQYSRSNDFPIFAERLKVLQEYMKQRKPWKLSSMWTDRRDYNSWYTFWAVLVFGTIGILLGVIQVVLSAIQVAYSIKAYKAVT